MKEIRGAEITLYSDAGGQGFLDLSPLQLAVALKAIGYRDYGDKYSIFEDDTLEAILQGEINPFRLSEVYDGEK